MHHNPNLNLVNTDAYTKFGQIPFISSGDIERKQDSDINSYSIKQISTAYVYIEKILKITFYSSLNEPRHEKTSFLHMRKQRRRSVSR